MATRINFIDIPSIGLSPFVFDFFSEQVIYASFAVYYFAVHSALKKNNSCYHLFLRLKFLHSQNNIFEQSRRRHASRPDPG